MQVTIWHNQNCSKSRATLELLHNNGHQPEVVLYKDTAPSADDIRAVLALLDCSAAELIRSGDALFKDLKLPAAPSEKDLIAAMAANPSLIERPVVFTEEKAAIGRPPENVLKLL